MTQTANPLCDLTKHNQCIREITLALETADSMVNSWNIHSTIASKIAADRLVTQFHLHIAKGVNVYGNMKESLKQ